MAEGKGSMPVSSGPGKAPGASPEPDGEPAQAQTTEKPPPRRSGRNPGAAGQPTPSAPAASTKASKPAASGARTPKTEPAQSKPQPSGRQRPKSATPAPASASAPAKGAAAARPASRASKDTPPAGKAGREASKGPAASGRSRLAPKPEDKEPREETEKKRGRGRGEAGRRLRMHGSVSFKEVSEDEAESESEEGEGGSGSEEEEGLGDEGPSQQAEEPESEIDETIYEPPREAALPAEVVVSESPGGAKLTIPSSAVGELLAAWNLMRAFSWQLRLSPFTFPDLCAAMASPLPTALMDELHLCVLRALAVDETPAERAEHTLDVTLLDAMTWPCYVWEWLRLTDDPLSEQEWVHRLAPGASPPGAPATQAQQQQPIPPATQAEPQAAADPAAAQTTSAQPPASGSAPRRVAFAPLADVAAMDAELAGVGAGHASLALARGAKLAFAGAGPQPPPAQPDYYALPVGVKAAILSRLCDHLLDCTTIRAEIDRRERQGQVVAGKGGQGGAFPILTPEQRKKEEKRAQTDANADCCVLCGQGGNLICCDGCPAAYHMRCIGQSSKSLGDGDWLCPECALGGRGEAAGLRIPAGARGRQKQPYYVMHGMLVRSGLPSVKSRGKHAEELEDSGAVPMRPFIGDAAAEELAHHAQRIRTGDDVPHPSSFDALRDPPKVKPEAALGPEAYVNKYKNGWVAAVASIRTSVEECKRQKYKKGMHIPTGTTGVLTVPELPAPLTLSKFQWVQMQGKSARQAVRCGKCHTCNNPSLRKGCLNPIVNGGEDTGPADTSKLSFLVAFANKVEREFWQLLEGPWAAGGGRGMAHKNSWVAAVRAATSVEQLAKAVIELEASLRPVALAPEWRAGSGAAPSAGGSRTPAASQEVSRAASVADLAAAPGAGSDEGVPAGVPESSQGAAAAASEREARAAADPYDLKFDTHTLRAGWEIDRRSHSAHVLGVNRLPRALLRKAARQAGWKPIPGVRYRRQKWSLASPRLEWIAATESAQTAAQLAISLRQLDAVLQWDTTSKPKSDAETPFFQASLLAKRPAAAAADGGGGYEYLLQMQPPPTPAPPQQQALSMLLQRAAAMLQMGQHPQQMQIQQQLQMQQLQHFAVQQQQQQQQYWMLPGAAAGAGSPQLQSQQMLLSTLLQPAQAGAIKLRPPLQAPQQQQQALQGSARRLGGLGLQPSPAGGGLVGVARGAGFGAGAGASPLTMLGPPLPSSMAGALLPPLPSSMVGAPLPPLPPSVAGGQGALTKGLAQQQRQRNMSPPLAAQQQQQQSVGPSDSDAAAPMEVDAPAVQQQRPDACDTAAATKAVVVAPVDAAVEGDGAMPAKDPVPVVAPDSQSEEAGGLPASCVEAQQQGEQVPGQQQEREGLQPPDQQAEQHAGPDQPALEVAGPATDVHMTDALEGSPMGANPQGEEQEKDEGLPASVPPVDATPAATAAAAQGEEEESEQGQSGGEEEGEEAGGLASGSEDEEVLGGEGGRASGGSSLSSGSSSSSESSDAEQDGSRHRSAPISSSSSDGDDDDEPEGAAPLPCDLSDSSDTSSSDDDEEQEQEREEGHEGKFDGAGPSQGTAASESPTQSSDDSQAAARELDRGDAECLRGCGASGSELGGSAAGRGSLLQGEGGDSSDEGEEEGEEEGGAAEAARSAGSPVPKEADSDSGGEGVEAEHANTVPDEGGPSGHQSALHKQQPAPDAGADAAAAACPPAEGVASDGAAAASAEIGAEGTAAAAAAPGAEGMEGAEEGEARVGPSSTGGAGTHSQPTSSAAREAAEEEDGAPSTQRSGPGARTRRCGVCKHCLNPAGKQVCLVLKAQREGERAQREEELAKMRADEALKMEDPAHLARLITANAFKHALVAVGEQELRSPDAPAAMAAKLRARLAVIGTAAGSPKKPAGSTSVAVKKERGEDGRKMQSRVSSSGRLSALAEVKSELGPTVQLPGGAALPLKVAMSSHQPVWVHERHLPLWLIKAYEEKLRREEANAAARDAAAAARSTQLETGGDREAARSAAHAAAAAAADACGVCGALHGEEPALDGLWICCDSCNRWFHGGCVGQTQEDMDGLREGQPWACPGCWDNNRRRERAARRQHKQQDGGRGSKLAGPASSPQPPPDGQVPQEGPRRGRPPKPFWQKADYQRKEQQALERIRRQQARDGLVAGAQAAVAAAADGGQAVAAPGEAEGRVRKKRRRESEEGQQQPTDAAGAAEAVAAKAERRQKRKRDEAKEPKAEGTAPRQHTQGGGEDEDEDLPVYCPLCKMPDYGRDLVECDSCRQWFHPECAGVTMEEVEAVPLWTCAGCQGKRMRAPSQAAVAAAIEAAREREEAEDAAGERTTKRARTSTGRISRGGAVVAAAPAGRAQEPAAARGGRSWAEAALRVLTKVQKLSSAEDFLVPVPKDVKGYYAIIKRPMDLGTVRRKLQKGKYASPQEVLADTRLIWANCRQFNEEGSEIVAAAQATQQALEKRWEREGLPIQAAQQQQQQEEEEEAPKAASTPKRSRGFLGAAGAAHAEETEGAAAADTWAAAAGAGAGGAGTSAVAGQDMPGGGSERLRLKLARKAGAEDGAAVAGRGAQAPAQQQQQQQRSSKKARQVPAPDWPTRAAKVLKQIMRLRDAESFELPVPRDYPGYHDIVKHPMDLGTVSKKLQKGKYRDPAQLKADVQLVFHNCRLFNDETAPVVAACANVEAAFKKHWKSAGVYESAPAAGAAATGANPTAAPGSQAGMPLDGGGGKHRGPFDWKSAARGVLYRVQLQKTAGWFMEPVRPDEAPDYATLVEKPMDLGTIFQKLKADLYPTPQDLLADVRLVWDNCLRYNGADSPITADCEATRAVFEASWVEKGLAQLAPLQAGATAGAQAAAPGAAPVAGASQRIAEAAALHSPRAGMGSPAGWRARAADGITRQQEQQQQQSGARADGTLAGGRSGGRARASAAEVSPPLAAPPSQADWVPKAQQALKKVLRMPDAQVFAEPVAPELAPDYLEVIQHPMDLGTIQRRLAAGQYTSPQAMAQDAELVWQNCRTYNQPGDAIWQMGHAVEAAFNKHWAVAGLAVAAGAATVAAGGQPSAGKPEPGSRQRSGAAAARPMPRKQDALEMKEEEEEEQQEQQHEEERPRGSGRQRRPSGRVLQL